MNAVSIFLEKKFKILVPESRNNITTNVITFGMNLESLGFVLSQDLMYALSAIPEKDLNSLYKEVVSCARKMVGAHKKFNPMYPNFPEQVAELAECDLYMNALLHYTGDAISDVLKVPCRFLPKYEKKEREELSDKEVSYKLIKRGTKEEFNSIFSSLLSSNGSLSESDKLILNWFVDNKQYEGCIPNSIPSKENLSYFVGKCLNNGSVAGLDSLKTATDVLRTVCSMSEGDVSLAKATKFKKVSRSVRRMILGRMEAIGELTEDMLRYKEPWKRLGEFLHPGEYKERFPKAYAAFQVLRNNEKFETFNSKVESSIKGGKTNVTLELLSNRPGELARRLDHLLRSQQNMEKFVKGEQDQVHDILGVFSELAHKVSTPVLVQVYAHFKNRTTEKGRAFFPKGNAAKLVYLEEGLPVLNDGVSSSVVKIVQETLKNRFSKLPPLGKVFVQDELRDQFVPFSQRSASKALRTIVRGSKVAMEDKNFLRFFIWWKDGESRTDLDLSACFYKDGFTDPKQVAYYNLKSMGCYHSGDITSAPNGAAEFIDVDVQVLLKTGYRYVCMCVNSFTNQPYKDLPECFAGFMYRDMPNSGEIFEPKTVNNKFDLTGETRYTVPMIFDLQEQKMIWTDVCIPVQASYSNNVRNNERSLSSIANAICSLKKMSLYDLFMLHAESRGTIVPKQEDADVVFSMHNGITPFDTDKIMSEYMKN